MAPSRFLAEIMLLRGHTGWDETRRGVWGNKSPEPQQSVGGRCEEKEGGMRKEKRVNVQHDFNKYIVDYIVIINIYCPIIIIISSLLSYLFFCTPASAFTVCGVSRQEVVIVIVIVVTCLQYLKQIGIILLFVCCMNYVCVYVTYFCSIVWKISFSFISSLTYTVFLAWHIQYFLTHVYSIS